MSAEHEAPADAYDRAAMPLVGMKVGDWYVKARVTPAQRPLYVVISTRTAESKGVRGHELVRLARRARVVGFNVSPCTQGRDRASA